MHNTIKALSDALRKKEFSATELTRHYLTRIKEHDAELNCFITLTEDIALEQAKRADTKLAKGEGTVTTGIPIAHKDIFCTQGIKTSCGSKMLDNFISPYNATAVEKLENAGCIMLGKTNMDEFAMGSSNETSYYGPCKNPWNTKAVPGGSSGGSAAAVAARLAPATTATDTGGSIRQPAALCGVSGLKPTYGRVSRYGMIAFASSLDQGGVVAQTAEDIAILLKEMSGFDEQDSTSLNEEVPNFQEQLNKPIKGLTIGLPKEYFTADLDKTMATRIEEALKFFESQGAKLKEISLPNSNLSIPTYYVIAPAEASSNLARFDGVRYGYRTDKAKDLIEMYENSRAEGFGDEVQRRIMIGTYVLSAGYYDAYYRQAQRVRRLIKNDFVEAFKEVDVIMGPTAPSPAFNIGEKSSNPLEMYYSDIFTIAANLAGLPAMSVPAGMIDDKPIGLHIIGNYLKEGDILNFAHQFQLQTDWHTKHPDGFNIA